MPDELIHSDLVEVALERTSGTSFEYFVNSFFPAIAGVNFVPLGGVHDGGADAFQTQSLWADSRAEIFYQASIEKDHRSKIRRTVTALRKGGRTPNTLIYVTSQKVQKLDAEERLLSDELKLIVRIRDRAYIAMQINDSLDTRNAFRTHLGKYLDLLKQIGAAQLISQSEHVRSPAIYVFLRQELDRRSDNQSLSEAVVDSLILWALEGTDPDQDKFKTKDEIILSIKEALPFASTLLGIHLDARLAILSSKSNPIGREIRHHRKDDHYCLPYETRIEIQKENAADETLRIHVLRILESRLSDGELIDKDIHIAAEIALRTLQLTFEREGLEFSAFLEDKRGRDDYPTIADHVDEVIIERGIQAPEDQSYKGAILEALRCTFYNSTPEERLFLSKLAHTYALLFSLQAEPRIVQYFEQMASDFYLYVGTDLIVRALSERYVRPDDQRLRTILKMLVDARSTLVLTEPVLTEVHHHLKSTDNEFRSYFAREESKITYEIARNCPKILIRAYFYARFDPPKNVEPPHTWAAYLQQFCNPTRLHGSEGKEDLKRYLLSTFRMKYESRAEIDSLITHKAKSQMDQIATDLMPQKASAELAMNDALMALAVYGRRERSGETAVPNVFGYRTWWLTSERTILNHTRDVVGMYGARYMMRPEFLLNFIAMAPKLSQVRSAYRYIFPSLLGIRLADRVKEDVYRDMMTKVNEAGNLEFGRVEAMVAGYSDDLKSDFRKVYHRKL
ncbi:MAG: hypothetical protein KGJ82_17850 [Nitrospirota bacterium]|nr:hypothetical protein [Nitrospirota bacterium]